jgi:hypothetical protein
VAVHGLEADDSGRKKRKMEAALLQARCFNKNHSVLSEGGVGMESVGERKLE